MNHCGKYPCAGCARVARPEMCEDKNCKRWQRWFLERWDRIHGYYQKHAGKQRGENR